MPKKFKLFYLALLLPLITFYWLAEPVEQLQFPVNQGVVDFGELEFSDKLFQLNGQWTFYPDELLRPNDKPLGKPTYVQVPARWTDYHLSGKQRPAIGYGTFLVKIHSDSMLGKELGITSDIIRTSSAVYINGKLVGAVGEPATSAEGYTAGNWPATHFFQSAGNDEIIIQVANYTHGDSGGIISPIAVGGSHAIFRARLWNIVADVVTVTVVFIVLMIFIGQYFQRNNQLELLWFSLSCLVAVLFFLAANEKLIFWLIPNLAYDVYLRIGYCCSVLIFYFLCRYIFAALKNSGKKTLLFTNISAAAMLLAFLLVPVTVFTGYRVLFFLWEIILLLIIAEQMIAGVVKKTDGYEYLAFAVVCFITMYAAYILDTLGLFSTGKVISVTVIMFLLSQMLFITERHKRIWLKKQTEANELEFLRAQINPHFIYNALGSVAALINIDPVKARYTLLDFSSYLRGMLNKENQRQLITLAEELELTRYYTDIESLRYDERLQVLFAVPTAMLQSKIPPFTVQIIVENAIKHSILDDYKTIVVRISGQITDAAALITVSDNGPGMSAELVQNILSGQTPGVGIYNASQRLKKYGGAISFKSDAAGSTVTIELRK